MHMEADTKGSPATHHFSTTSCRLPRTFQLETAQDFEPHRKAQPNRNTHKMGIEIEARRVVGCYSPHLRALVFRVGLRLAVPTEANIAFISPTSMIDACVRYATGDLLEYLEGTAA
jgi:hypothetical protein